MAGGVDQMLHCTEPNTWKHGARIQKLLAMMKENERKLHHLQKESQAKDRTIKKLEMAIISYEYLKMVTPQKNEV